jgi:hypothetical protein
MPATITMDADQRRGLYELIRNDLGGLDDVRVALDEKSDFATAERLGRQFLDDFRLLGDIGWHPGDERRAFEVTMPLSDLRRLLYRLREEAERLLQSSSERRSREEEEAVQRRFRSGANACEELLVALDARGGDAA